MPRSSGQKAMPARAISFDRAPINSRPPKATEPVRCVTIPMIDFSVVVLPAPFRPSSVTTSPGCTSNETPCRMCDSPYQACRSLTASSGARTSSMARPHIGFLDFGVVGDRGVVALGQHPAARQHGDAIAEIFDHIEIV